MSENKNKWGVGIGISLLIGLMIYGIYLLSGKDTNINWTTNYKKSNEDPYSVGLLKHTLQSSFEEDFIELEKELSEQLVEDSIQTYFFIGDLHYPDSTDLDAIKEHIRKGKTAYIISNSIRDELMEYLYYDECDYESWKNYSSVNDSVIILPSRDSLLELKKLNRFKAYPRRWSYVPDYFFCNNGNNFTPLKYFKYGTIDTIPIDTIDIEDDNEDDVIINYDLLLPSEEVVFQDSFVNFFSVQYGKGHVYFHTTPLAFTNYTLREENYFEYLSDILSDIPHGKILWDTKNSIRDYSRKKPPGQNTNPFTKDNLTKHIIKNPPLRWSFYSLITLGLLYILFQAKRRQRTIPIVTPNENKSLEHSKQISSIYFKQNSNVRVAKKMVTHLIFHIKEKYGITINLQDINTDHIDRLSQVTKKSKEEIMTMLTLCKNVQEQSYTTDNTLFDLYTLTYSFKHE